MSDAKDLKGKTGVKRLTNAFFDSKDGFTAAYQSEEAFRQEFWLLVIGSVIAVVLPVNLLQTVALIAVLLLLLIAVGIATSSGNSSIVSTNPRSCGAHRPYFR